MAKYRIAALSVALLVSTGLTAVAEARPSGGYSSSSRSYSPTPRSYSPPARTVSSGYAGGGRSSTSAPPVSSEVNKESGRAALSALSAYRNRNDVSASAAPSSPPVRQSPSASVPPASAPVAAGTTHFVPVPVPSSSGSDFMTGAAVGMMMSHHDDRNERPYSPPSTSAPAPATGPDQSSPEQDDLDDDDSDLDTGAATINITPHAEAVLSGAFSMILDLSVLMALGVGAFFLIRKLRRDDKLRQDVRESSDPSNDHSEVSDEYGVAVKERLMSEWGCPSGLLLGSNMRLQTSAFLSDPDVAVPLHVEPAALDHSDGSVSIMGIGYQSVRGRFDLYPDASEPEFIRIEVEPGGDNVTDQSGRIVSARFFGWIDRIMPTASQEWASWIDETDGIMGMPSFNTRDGVEWSRVIPGDQRISPECRREQTVSASDDKIVSQKVSEVLYARATGYADGYPQTEYLLLRLVENQEVGVAYILIMAGVDLSRTGLKITL